MYRQSRHKKSHSQPNNDQPNDKTKQYVLNNSITTCIQHIQYYIDHHKMY